MSESPDEILARVRKSAISRSEMLRDESGSNAAYHHHDEMLAAIDRLARVAELCGALGQHERECQLCEDCLLCGGREHMLAEIRRIGDAR